MGRILRSSGLVPQSLICFRTVLLLATVASVGCSGAPQPTISRTPAPAEPTSAPAAAGMCGEHGVLEAVCTKCNPSLIPVFQAKGDWCAEHGFPESFCPICHPDKGGKPSVAVVDDGAPRNGTKVRFKSKETARMAGLRTEPAVQLPGESTVEATARILFDATRTAAVNARAAGVVRAIQSDVGTLVERGGTLAVIESAGVGLDQSRFQSARGRMKVAEATYERAQKLHDKGIAPLKEVLAARQEWEAAGGELASAQASLKVVGASGDGSARYALTSPIAGVVSERNVSVGRLVDTDQILFQIVDTSRMLAEIDIPESEVRHVAVGQRVTLEVDGLEGRELAGTLTYIAPEIDPHTRTVKGRVALENRDGALRANMFARARIQTASSRSGVMVPEASLQQAKGVDLVFVRLAEDLYEARRVRARPARGELVEISGPVKAGELVVTEGSFLLKTETLKESIGAGCCEVD